MTEEHAPMEPPEMHAPHAGHTGHRWIDLLLGLTAVLVSAVSLYVAIDNGRSMQQLVAANSWPNLQADSSVNKGDTPGSIKFVIEVTNNGIGPAWLETMELWGSGAPLRNGDDVGLWLKRIGGGASLSANLEGSTLIGSVVAAGTNTRIIALTTPDAGTWVKPFVTAAGALESRICYCSVFDECFISDTRTARARPVKVNTCPVAAAPYDDDLSSIMAARDAKPAP